MVFLVKKICLDTDICISILKNTNPDIKGIISENEVCISVITLFELFLKKTNLNVIESFVSELNHIPINNIIAKKASIMHKELKEKGESIEIRDLFIGATCIVNEIELLTNNKKHFERLREFGLILVDF